MPKKPRKPLSRKKPKKTTEKTLRSRADKVAGEWFRRDASCVACGYGEGIVKVVCGGPIQWCHLVRRACRYIRHSRFNAVPMCRDHHVYFTHRPEEWHLFIEELYPGRWRFLRELDLSRQGLKLTDVYEEEMGWYKGHDFGFAQWDMVE